jgi:DNA-directed RNA polymerase specialized sigma24 family protein
VLGCSTNAVGVRLHKARKRLQAELKGGGVSRRDEGVELEARS